MATDSDSRPAPSGAPPANGSPAGPRRRTPGRGIRWVALLIVVAWLAIGGIGGPLVGQLSSVQQNDQGSLLPVSAESSSAGDELARFATDAPEGPPFFLVLVRDAGTLTPSDFRAAQAFLAALPALSLGEDTGGMRLGDLLATTPSTVIPSEDGRALFAPITLDADRSADRIAGQVGVNVAADALRAAADTSFEGTGLIPKTAGPASFIADIGKAFGGIDALLLGVALSVVFVILVIVYRSPILPFVVLSSAVFGLAAAALVVYPLATRGTVLLNGQSQGILSILVIGAATDYALLVVARYREELHQHESTWVAMKAAWRGTVEPISASAATVILGLLCLLLSDLGGTRGLGPISALGILGALAGALTFLPAVLILIGRRAFWPRVPQVDHVRAEDAVGTRGLWGRVAGAVQARPRTIWIGTTVLLIAAAGFATQFRADGLRQADFFRTSVEYVDGERALDEHFPGGTGAPARLVVPQDRAVAVAALLGDVDGVAATQVGTGGGAPGAPPTPPLVRDGRVIVQATLEDPADSLDAGSTVQRIRDTLRSDAGRQALADAPTPHVGGVSAQLLDTKLAAERDNRVVVPAILGVVVLVLIVLLRSLVAPLLLAVANILSFLATMGVSALAFNHLFGFPNADPSTPLYGFVFLIALGIDYSIFLMTRIREETPKRGTRDAAIVGLAVTGGVITSAGVVLAATFSALFILPLIIMAQIAFFVAFGVLLDTLVVRSLLLPGLVRDIGAPIWWPGRVERRDRPEQAHRGSAKTPGGSAAPVTHS